MTIVKSTADLHPHISIDVSSEFSRNINQLAGLISTSEPTPVPAGASVKVHGNLKAELKDQSSEGEVIDLSVISQDAVQTIDMTVKPHRAASTAQAIQTFGAETAVVRKDDALVAAVYAKAKAEFAKVLKDQDAKLADGGAGKSIHHVAAKAMGKVANLFDGFETGNVLVFANPEDISELVAGANYQVQTVANMTVLVSPAGAVIVPFSQIEKGKAYATASSNVGIYYVPAGDSELGRQFNLSADEFGYIGLTHSVQTSNASIETLVMGRVVIAPHVLGLVAKYTIAPTA